MPKERIYSTKFVPEDDQHPAPRLAVQVSWSKEQEHLQVATIDAALPEDGEEGIGWFVSLDRRQINDLIRVLRRARDGAFGADA